MTIDERRPVVTVTAAGEDHGAPGGSPPSVEDNAARARRRRRMVMFSLPVVLALVIVASYLLGRSVFAGTAISQYERGSFVESTETAGSLLEQNFVEPWIAWFDRGGALAAREDFVPAIDDFERSLAVVPEEHKCEVVVNLSLGWERLADGYAQAGFYAGAELLYRNAADVLASEPCTPPEQPVDGRDLGQSLQEARARVEAKLDGAKYFSDGQGDQAPTTPQERLDQLNEQGEGAAEEKAEDDARDRAETGSGGFTNKPW